MHVHYTCTLYAFHGFICILKLVGSSLALCLSMGAVPYHATIIKPFSIKRKCVSSSTLCDIIRPVYKCAQESEEFLSQLVIKKTIYARIDRPAGIVTFRENKDPNEVLNEWSHNLNSLMALVSKTTHLINKAEMVHSIK